MRILVLADIHANLPALEAVLTDAGSVDLIWNLGDTVGYGPFPKECLAVIRDERFWNLVGNHDLGAIGRVPTDWFNASARASNRWTSSQLDDAARAWLCGLPASLRVAEGMVLAHASPRDPVWEYLDSAEVAQANFACFNERLGFIGHSHIPRLFHLPPGGPVQEIAVGPQTSVSLASGRFLLNPGGVGQPRDGDPRAAYGIFDIETQGFLFRRVAYDIARAQRGIVEAGLPAGLAERLRYGV